MKINNLIKQIIKEEVGKSLTEDKVYHRLSDDVIGNKLYPTQRNLTSLYESLQNGNDLDLKRFDSIIKSLQDIRKLVETYDKK